jgi:hypothetical protein
MSVSPDILPYYGKEPPVPRTLLGTCWRILSGICVFVILLIVIAVRAALLLGGFICVFAGTLLLTLGGRRSAAEELSRWRIRARSLLRLWIADILRPLRRQRTPVPVIPA